MMKKLLATFFLVLAAPLISINSFADEIGKPTNRILLYVDDIAITEDMYRQHFAQKGYVLPADKKQQKALQNKVINEIVNILLMAKQAVKQELDKTPEVQLSLEVARYNLLGKALVGEYLQNIDVQQSELDQAYKDIQAEAVKRAEYNVAHILLDDEKTANEIVNQLKAGADFTELAKSSSIDPSAKDGGELGWVTDSMIEPEFGDAMHKLSIENNTSQPVKTRYGWHVIKLNEIKIQDVPPLQEITAKLKELITQRKLMAKVQELRNQAKITKPEDKLKQLPAIDK